MNYVCEPGSTPGGSLAGHVTLTGVWPAWGGSAGPVPATGLFQKRVFFTSRRSGSPRVCAGARGAGAGQLDAAIFRGPGAYRATSPHLPHPLPRAARQDDEPSSPQVSQALREREEVLWKRQSPGKGKARLARAALGPGQSQRSARVSRTSLVIEPGRAKVCNGAVALFESSVESHVPSGTFPQSLLLSFWQEREGAGTARLGLAPGSAWQA